MCIFIFSPIQNAFAETSLDQLAEGAYSIEYVILHAETDSVSIANDYFEKPATLYIENGERFIQFPLNHSQWTKELQAPLGDSFVDVDVISEDEEADVRVVEFKLDRGLTEPLEFKMHVLIEEMEPVYDHRYTVRFDFDESSIKLLEDAPVRETKQVTEFMKEVDDSESEKVVAHDHIDDSSTSNTISITMVVILVVITVLIIFILFNRRKKTS